MLISEKAFGESGSFEIVCLKQAEIYVIQIFKVFSLISSA